MTTELEQEFFKVFGIEPIMLCDCEFKNLYDYRIEYGQDVCIYPDESTAKNPCLKCKLAKQIHPLYPEITAEKLLKLICICSHYEPLNNYKITLKELKNNCLKRLIELSDIDWIKNDVRSLFNEGK